MSISLTTITVRPEHCDPLFLLKTLGEGREYCALLESLDRNHAKNDFSFLALGMRDSVVIADGKVSGSSLMPDGPAKDPLEPFKNFIGQGKEGTLLTMGYIGYLSYEAVRFFDDIQIECDPNLPDALFVLPELLLRIDHERHEVTIVAHKETKEDLKAIETIIHNSPFHDDAKNRAQKLKDAEVSVVNSLDTYRQISREDYCKAVRLAQEEILKGEAFQIVLSQELRVQEQVSPIDVYAELRIINPSPYMYYFRTPTHTVVGASPETLLRVDGRKMLYRPIAGTRKRTGDPKIDTQMKEELLKDPKERAEHQMLVDLGRNDLGRIATIGSVVVEDPFHLEEYAHVFHIVSNIRGELKEGLSALDALKSVFPAGTLTGAPKLRAMEIIQRLEKSPRGMYGGAFGYIDHTGNIDFAITIRTLLFDAQGISLRVGAGIVKDSIPEREDDECLHKAKSCLSAVIAAKRSSTHT